MGLVGDDIRRVVVVRTSNALGDMLLIVPALRALRTFLPEAHIALVGMPRWQLLVDRLHYLDALLEFPGWPGMPDVPFDAARTTSFLQEVQAKGFDLACQFHGNGASSNTFTAMLGASRVAGFFLPGQYEPDPELMLPYPVSEHELRRYLRLLEHIGIAPAGEHLEFPLWDADFAALGGLPEADALQPHGYVCLHPGSNMPSRRWAPEHFATVGDALAEQGFLVVLTGAAGEATVTDAVAVRMRHEAIDLAGKTSLGALAALLSQSRLLIANDTGIAHLATALHTPSVVVFRWSQRARWEPLDSSRHRALGVVNSLPTNGGPAIECRCLRDGCLRAQREADEVPPIPVTPLDVLDAAAHLLAQMPPGVAQGRPDGNAG